jgi:hypothetical protein
MPGESCRSFGVRASRGSSLDHVVDGEFLGSVDVGRGIVRGGELGSDGALVHRFGGS